MDFRTFIEAGTKGEGPNASGGRGGATSMKPGMPQQGGSINPEPKKKEILGGSFGGGGPKKSTETPPSPLSPRGRNTQKWNKTPISSMCPHGIGDPPGPPQPVPPSEFVSRYMKWQPPANAIKGQGWPVKSEKTRK